MNNLDEALQLFSNNVAKEIFPNKVWEIRKDEEDAEYNIGELNEEIPYENAVEIELDANQFPYFVDLYMHNTKKQTLDIVKLLLAAFRANGIETFINFKCNDSNEALEVPTSEENKKYLLSQIEKLKPKVLSSKLPSTFMNQIEKMKKSIELYESTLGLSSRN